jgi:hypothetical protein
MKKFIKNVHGFGLQPEPAGAGCHRLQSEEYHFSFIPNTAEVAFYGLVKGCEALPEPEKDRAHSFLGAGRGSGKADGNGEP